MKLDFLSRIAYVCERWTEVVEHDPDAVFLMEKVTDTVIRNAVEGTAEESGTPILEYSVYADSGTDPGHYIILLESDREIMPENGTFIQRS